MSVIIRILLSCRLCLPLGLALLVNASATAQTTTNSQPPATEADAAWREVQNALMPPPTPREWQGRQPTEEERERYINEQGRLAGIAADKAKAFAEKYSDHPKANDARRQYARMLQTAVMTGNTNRATELEEVQQARLKDPNTPVEERFQLRYRQLMKEASASKKEGQQETMALYEEVARQLIKEFPKRDEPYQLLLSIASNTEGKHSEELMKEIAAADVSDEIKAQAKAFTEKLGRVGKPLALKFKAVDDKEVDLEKLKGKVVLVDFWATWCGPCVKELPNVRAAYEKLHDKGFEIIGISFDSDQKKLETFIEREKMPWPQYYDGKGWGNAFGKEFGINSIPAMWLVDKKGMLRDLNARAELASKVEKLLAE